MNIRIPPINEELILEIAHMVTEETLGKDTNSGWRGSHVQVISVRKKVIYPASICIIPQTEKIPVEQIHSFHLP